MILRWLLALILCVAIPAAFAADVKISALPAASSANTTDEYPANQSGTTFKVTGAQIASLAITNTLTSSATAGSRETWQVLNSSCSANTGTTMATCMTTNSLAAGYYDFEYIVYFLGGGTAQGIRLEVGTTGTFARFRATTLVTSTPTTTNTAEIANMGKSGFLAGAWGTSATTNTSNNQVLSMGGFGTANETQMAIVRGSFALSNASSSLYLQAAGEGGAAVTQNVQVLQDTQLILRKMN